jgi:uncharacterized membrane protein YfcA
LQQNYLLLFVSILGGVLNSVAGGSGLIFFPTLLMTGVSPISANATTTVVSLPGYIAGIYVYRQRLSDEGRISLLLGSISLVGGMLGAMLLIVIPNTSFDYLVPWLLLLATVLFTLSNSIITPQELDLREIGEKPGNRLLKFLLIQFLIAIYGGFYGGGMSFLILAKLKILGIKDINQMNALKILLMGCIDSFAVITFIFADLVAWPQAFLMMVGTVIGGYGGAYYSGYFNPSLVRTCVSVVGFVMTGYFFLFK